VTGEAGKLVIERLRCPTRRHSNATGAQGIRLHTTSSIKLPSKIMVALSDVNVRMARFGERLARVQRQLELTEQH
jgi:hypothetical protein